MIFVRIWDQMILPFFTRSSDTKSWFHWLKITVWCSYFRNRRRRCLELTDKVWRSYDNSRWSYVSETFKSCCEKRMDRMSKSLTNLVDFRSALKSRKNIIFIFSQKYVKNMSILHKFRENHVSGTILKNSASVTRL